MSDTIDTGEARTFTDGKQAVILSQKGGTIERWVWGGDLDILYPRGEVMIDGTPKMRGGMHACFPNFGKTGRQWELPQHGPLRDTMGEWQRDDSLLLRSDAMLGPLLGGCEVRVQIELLANGFVYRLTAKRTGNLRGAVRLNWGLHPYFRTPRKHATLHMAARRTFFGPEMLNDSQSCSIDLSVVPMIELSIPGLGKIEIEPQAGYHEARWPTIVNWRDSEDYICIEPVAGRPGSFGEGESTFFGTLPLELSCAFRFIP